jgi:hypothetical protein
MRYVVFAFDADGDMGWGEGFGAFKSVEAADRKAEQIRRHAANDADSGQRIEVLVVPLNPGGASVRAVLARV